MAISEQNLCILIQQAQMSTGWGMLASQQKGPVKSIKN